MSDDQIQRAIESGQRNAEGFTLVKNWCAHVRIERFGGVGMVEQMTGFPIGHHNLACDHAPAGGMACWDIRDAALCFYDANCKDCSKRQAVNIPNIGIWVAERDTAIKERKTVEDALAKDLAFKLAARQSERSNLRDGLLPAAADVVDQIDELDSSSPSPNLIDRLYETARLAPEAFPPPVIEYIFSLVEAQEHWACKAGLKVLATLRADPRRLARSAMLCLKNWNATETAAAVLVARLTVADETLISSILPNLIRLAAPSDGPVLIERRPRVAPIIRLHAAFPAQVAATIDKLFDGDPQSINLAACAVKVLTQRDPTLGERFARDLVSKLARAKWLPDPDDYHHEYQKVAQNLEKATVIVFRAAPVTVDALFQDFRIGASDAGEARIFSAYARVLQAGRFRKKRAVSAADHLAFQRLLWEAPKTASDHVFREIHSAIGRDPDDLIDLATAQVDNFLGAAIQLDEMITALDSEPQDRGATMFDVLGRSNRRSNLVSLRNGLVRWAAKGAAAGETPASYLQVLENLPEGRDALAGSMIENTVALMDSAVSLNTVLPTLFTALVGTSVLRRGNAARAIGEMPWRHRENAPNVLWEAFLPLLTDPYVYVHASAIRALRRIHLPASFDPIVRLGIWSVLSAHAKSSDQEDLLLDCIKLLVMHYLTDQEKSGRVGAFLVTLLAKMPTWRLSNDIARISRQLANAPGLVELLISHLLDPQTTEHGEEYAIEALSDLPVDVIHNCRTQLASIPIAADRGPPYWILDLIEILSRSRAWAEAEQLAEAALAAIPETVRAISLRLMFQLAHGAAAFESALAQGDYERATTLAAQWREMKFKQEENDREKAQRNDPLRNIFGSA